MDFTEMQALFQIRHIVLLTGLALLFSQCGNVRSDHTLKSPLVEVYNNGDDFISKRGVLYHSDTVFTGWMLRNNVEEGYFEKLPYINGKLHGIAEAEYSNGNKAFMRSYENGKKEGEHKMWYPSGQLKAVGQYHADYYQGNVLSWYPSGQKYSDFNYEDGQESGAQKMWKSDGRIKANYVVKKGRRYGLTGVKNCVNVFEE